MSHYKKKPLSELTRHQRSEALAQLNKETRILKNHGYITQLDAWKLIEDPLTGKPTCYLTGFGGVKKISPFEQG